MDSFFSSPYEQMIATCLVHRDFLDKEALVAAYIHCNERKLFEFCEMHEVATIVAARLEELGKSSPMWRTVSADWKYRLTQRFEQLELLATALKQANVPVIVLKNAAIARAIYPVLEECPMGNFDLLVKQEDLLKADEVIQKCGFAPSVDPKTALQAAIDGQTTEYSMELCDDVLWLKLMWNPVPKQLKWPGRDAFIKSLFVNAVAVPDSDLKILDPASNLFHVCLNIAKHDFVCTPGIRMYTEIDRIVRAYPKLDWNAFTRYSTAFPGSVYLCLYLAHLLLKTPVPPEVFKSLQPQKGSFERSMWAIRKMGFFYPKKRMPTLMRLIMGIR